MEDWSVVLKGNEEREFGESRGGGEEELMDYITTVVHILINHSSLFMFL